MTSPVVLVLNSGSSSLKYQLIEPDSGESLADGIVEQIGEPSSPVTDHGAALRVAFEKLSDDGIDLKACGLVVVGHRVVHGGEFAASVRITREIRSRITALADLAPLHNPPSLATLAAAEAADDNEPRTSAKGF